MFVNFYFTYHMNAPFVVLEAQNMYGQLINERALTAALAPFAMATDAGTRPSVVISQRSHSRS